jgi:hypothetical protein
MPPYLTATEITTRLSTRFGIEVEITDGDADIAASDLDSQAPFVGYPTDDGQEREFPRDGETEPPAAILDWVALKALELSREHEPGLRSESAGRASQAYSEPKRSQLERRMSLSIARKYFVI